ncbi:hypothetical protein F4814DRAFT_302795 [Daldinia grandis]|nr:hypothetical protein F4814DRAFT_302795 [Daldinia grandis]
MDSHTFPKPRPKGVLKTLSIDVKPLPSPSRVKFDIIAHDIQTGDEVPPSPRTREQFYHSVLTRRKRAKLTRRITDIKAEFAAKRALEEAEYERTRLLAMKRKIAEMDRAVVEAYAKTKKYDSKVGFGLNEGWYSDMILCMQAVYC